MELNDDHKRYDALIALLESTGGLTDVELIQRKVQNTGIDTRYLERLEIIKLRRPQEIWELADYGNKLHLNKGDLTYMEYHTKLEKDAVKNKRWSKLRVRAAFILSLIAVCFSGYTGLLKPNTEQKELETKVNTLIQQKDSLLRLYVDSSLKAKFDTTKVANQLKPTR